MINRLFILLSFTGWCCHVANAQLPQEAGITAASAQNSFWLRNNGPHKVRWMLKKATDTENNGALLSLFTYTANQWLPATVPGTVLQNLVNNHVFPDPYYGDNNRKSKRLIPDIAEAGREYYHYWYRTPFSIPADMKGKKIWLKIHGINYRSVVWVNGRRIGQMAGMFNAGIFDITGIANFDGANAIALDIQPVDIPGSNNKPRQDRPGAIGENRNGGDGEIGKNVTMLMSAGWDFTAPDGIRDRNTGIWRDIEIFATGSITLEDAFVQTQLPIPDTGSARATITVDVVNHSNQPQHGILQTTVAGAGISIRTPVQLAAGERKSIRLTPEQYHQLLLQHPRLWWPLNKGQQHLYTLDLKFSENNGRTSHHITQRFGIRDIRSDRNTPDSSRRFLVNGHPVFIRGTNWVPEAMLRNDVQRTYAELRYTRQAGINMIRLWGGGIAESDYFYSLCDELGILVWSEFWLTGDTRFPQDKALYMHNLAATVKRIRTHASQAYYVSANESDEVKGAGALIHSLDSTLGYQVQSECCGVHDGSPYKYENPMQYFENTASRRGSRVDGFNPEYGTPCLPIESSLKQLMPAHDLWPVNDSVWNYQDGGGFHGMTTKYRQAVDQWGSSATIGEFARKAQLVGAINYRAIWEVWNASKFNYGDRFASGFLFWYHNSPLPQTASRMYDWWLEPTAALYYSQNGLAPLHPQFNYLNNSVSVYNDYRKTYNGYKLTATVYDIYSRPLTQTHKVIDIPADGLVKDVMQLQFPDSISQVHFIALSLTNERNVQVANSFYWRSKDIYKGPWTMTGPAVSGFSTAADMPAATVTLRKAVTKLPGKYRITATLTNTGNRIAFFTQLRLQYKNGQPVRPAFYDDNFFTLLPYEKKQVTIECNGTEEPDLLLSGWNINNSKY